MKDTPELKAARSAYAAAEKNELEKRLQHEVAVIAKEEAYRAIKAAKIARDATLPSCNLVTMSPWSSTKSVVKMVILRKTPAGALFVRHVGGDDASADKYKAGHDGVFRRSTKSATGNSWLEDVPAEFQESAK